MIDDYRYPGTNTLINRFGIKDSRVLTAVENDVTFLQIATLLKAFEENPDKTLLSEPLTPETLKKIHHFLFSDIYCWAGEFRRCDIAKRESLLGGRSVDYPPPDSIIVGQVLMEDALNSVFSGIHSFDCYIQQRNAEHKPIDKDVYLKVFAEKITQLWVCHPFREGNTRTISLFAKGMAYRQGFALTIAAEPGQKSDQKSNQEQESVIFRDALVLSSDGKPEAMHDILRRNLSVLPASTLSFSDADTQDLQDLQDLR